ncbi:hypothetical protein THRCLA_04737 [Thraustotheca clavata]|uniref:Nuclear pore complex protein n=1 Tax=Thraustotheca clavata TaxID=74557 RepID=A0A1V9ZY54_9STRA|nr:hypothetical protein THRCLA_04737 [Thraustotheca clavata]
MWSTGGKSSAPVPRPTSSKEKIDMNASNTNNKDTGGVQAVLALASSLTPAALANVLPEIHVNLMCVYAQTGSIVLLGANGRICYLNLQQANPTLQDLTPASAMTSILTTATSLSFNNSGTHVLVEASASSANSGCDLYTFELPLGTRDAPVSGSISERVLVKFKDGTSRTVTLAKKKGVETIQRAMETLTAEERTKVKTICQDIFDIDVQRVQLPPNVRSRQALWHPLSDVHLAVLTTIEDVRLIDVQENSTEQVHVLHCTPSSSTAVRSTALSFGPMTGWEAFTCYVVRSNGDLYALNPFVPSKKANAPTSLIMFLKQKTEALLLQATQKQSSQDVIILLKAQRHWLQELWPTTAPRTSSSKFSAPLHDEEPEKPSVFTRINSKAGINHETWPVQLQGPFTRQGPTWKSINGKEEVLSIAAVPYSAQDNNIGQNPVLALAYSSGHVEILVLEKEVRPQWQTSNGAVHGTSNSAFLAECLNLGTDVSGGKAIVVSKPSMPFFFYVFHSTSVHSLHVQWMRKPLAQPFTSSVRRVFSISPDALASTHILGAAIVQTVELGNLLLVHLVNGTFEIVNLSAAAVDIAALRAPTPSSSSTTPSIVPLQKLIDAVSTKRPLHATAHVAGSTPMSQATMATVEFTLDHVKQLNDEVVYLQDLHLLSKNRLLIHKEMAASQTTALNELQKNISAFEGTTNELASRISQIQARQTRLNTRAAAALQAIRDNQHVVTKAERKYKQDLVEMQTQVRRMTPKVVQLNMDAEKLLRTMNCAKAPVIAFSQDKERMCHDVLTAETQLIADAKAILADVQSKLQSMKLA